MSGRTSRSPQSLSGRGHGDRADGVPSQGLLVNGGLDTAITQLGLGTYATAGIARLEQTAEEMEQGVTRLRWASAGHLSPVVVDQTGKLIDILELTGHLMLGVEHTAQRDQVLLTLERGFTVLLYTDGLAERPGSDLDAGVSALRTLVSELAGFPLEEVCDRLLDRLVEGRPADDVAIVAVRLHRQDRPRPAEAGSNSTPVNVQVPWRER